MTTKKLGPKSLVKIGPVTAEILLIWTNVTNFFGVIIFVDQNVLGQNFFKTQNFIRALSFQTRNFIGPEKNFELKFPLYPKLSQTDNFFQTQKFFEPNFSKTFWNPKNFVKSKYSFDLEFFRKQIFSLDNKFFDPNIFEPKMFLEPWYFFTHKNLFLQKFFFLLG